MGNLNAEKKIEMVLTFIGVSSKKGVNDPNKVYVKAKFNDEETNDVYEFLVKDEFIEQVGALKKYSPCTILLRVYAYNGQANLAFAGIKTK